MARAITIGSIVFTVLSLALAVIFARKRSRIRIGFDLARAVVGVAAILVMAAITQITTPGAAIALAIAVGLGLGFAQGSSLEIISGERGFYSKRSPIAIALWGAGIVIMQAAGLAARTGTMRIGQTIAWFSTCIGIGLMVGRNGPLQNAKQAVAGAGVAALVAALAVPTLLPGTAATARAADIELTGEQLCELLPGDILDLYADVGGDGPQDQLTTFPSGVMTYGDIIGCEYQFGGTAEGGWIGRAIIWQWTSSQGAVEEAGAVAEDPGWGGILVPVDKGIGEANFEGVRGERLWSVAARDRFLFIVAGREQDGDILGAMRAIDAAISELVGEAAPGSGSETGDADDDPDASQEEQETPPEPDETDVAGSDESDSVDATGPAPVDTDESIDPEEAAQQAIAGLIAAAAIGLITWAEAAAEIGQIVTGLGGTAGQGITEPFIDPYDQQPLEEDPKTGMVFWPWDGGEGHWVDRSEVPGLLDGWNRELDAETARRVGIHEAQREQNWNDLLDRIRRSQLEDATRQTQEQARLDDFDRRIEAARAWMEQDDAASLGVLDRIMDRVANQGFATAADIAEADRILDRARGFSTTMENLNAEAWAVIEGNAAAVAEISIKAATIVLDPTFGLGSGFAWGAVESLYDGDSIPRAAVNGTLNAGVWATGYAVGTWAPGRAALGSITWSAGSGAVLAGGETLLRGGSLSDAWHMAQVGFGLGGLGGMAERAATIGSRPPAQLPTVRTRLGGPRVGYSNPRQPQLAPPERGGVGARPPTTSRIRVEPGGPRVAYDEPLDTQRHVDGGDPRYEPWDPRFRPARDPVPFDSEPPRTWVSDPAEPTPVDPLTEPPPPAPVERLPAEYPPGGPPQPPKLIEVEGGPSAGRPPPQPPEVTAPDVVGETHLVDLPESPPPPIDIPDAPPPAPPIDVPEGSPPPPASRPPIEAPSVHSPPAQRPSTQMHGSELVDNVMKQPDFLPRTPRPVGGTIPDEILPTYVDGDGGIVVGNRRIGNFDRKTDVMRNLDGEPIRIAEDIETGRPVGYLEQPSVPEGQSPAYNSRGELAGHVDADGFSTIGGEKVKVAIDHRGNLVPYDGPIPGEGPVPQHLAPENLRGQSRLPGTDVEPVTGGGRTPDRAGTSGPPATGGFDSPRAARQPLDHTPYGQPVTAGDGAPPAGLRDIDVNPRIPVLDESGSVTHFVEPGPREIHYDAGGNPVFVQRQFPAEQPLMSDIGLDGANFPGARMMPAPENVVIVESRTLLTGPGAPSQAPEVAPPTPPGGDLL